jgi:hypothetical protein
VNRGVLARLVSGVGVVAVLAAAAATAHVLPPPVLTARDLSVLTVPPPITSVVCPGPVRLLTGSDASPDLSYDPAFARAPAGSSSVARGVALSSSAGGVAGVAEWHPIGKGAGTGLAPTGAESAVIAESTLAGALVLTGAPTGRDPAAVGAAVATTTPAGDLRGLAAASCAYPGTDLWFVGGSTELGSSARLVMQNAGATAATVTIEMWGANGSLTIAGPRDFLVPPGTEREVLLEGLAAEQHAIAVHLRANGGSVAGYLQDGALRGYQASGIDLVVPGSAPDTHQSVPGVALHTPVVPGVPNVLRLLAPGTTGTRASITVLGPDGVVDLPGASQVELAAGAVTDVTLDGLPDGDYTFVVDSAAPVVAGAMVVRSGVDPAAPIERAWVAAVAASPGGLIALPPGPDARIDIGSTAVSTPGVEGPATGVLRLVSSDGGTLRTQRVSVSAGSTLVLHGSDLAAVGDLAGVELTADPGSALVMAAVLTDVLADGGAGISIIVATPPVRLTGDVTVRDDPTTGLRPASG